MQRSNQKYYGATTIIQREGLERVCKEWFKILQNHAFHATRQIIQKMIFLCPRLQNKVQTNSQGNLIGDSALDGPSHESLMYRKKKLL